MLLAQSREWKLTSQSSWLTRLPAALASQTAGCVVLLLPVLPSQNVLSYLVVAAAPCLPSPTTRPWRCRLRDYLLEDPPASPLVTSVQTSTTPSRAPAPSSCSRLAHNGGPESVCKQGQLLRARQPHVGEDAIPTECTKPRPNPHLFVWEQ